jgi:predicted negative regulator of RcsB-dependent stress response
VRVGEHPAFSRLVFDWNNSVGYRIDREPAGTRERLSIVFDQPAEFNPGRWAKKPAKNFAWVDAKIEATGNATDMKLGAVVHLDVPAGALLAESRNKNMVIFDFAPADLGIPVLETAAGPPNPMDAAPDSVPSDPRGIPLALKAAVLENGARVTFPWPTPTTLAAFERGGYFWLVFDQPAVVDLGDLARAQATADLGFQQFPVAKATLVRLSPAAGATVFTEQSGNNWSVVISTDAAAAAAEGSAIETEIQPSEVGGGRIVFGQKSGTTLEVEDATTGEPLQILTISTPNRGIPVARSFVQFDLLATRQGIVLNPRSEGISLRRDEEGVAVAASDGLIISAQRASSGGGPLVFRICEWRRGGRAEFHSAQSKLLDALIRSPEAGRASARFDLAEFYFANGFDAEAHAVLAQIAAQHPESQNNRLFRALRGATLFELGRFQQARADLNSAMLDGLGEISIWRAMLAAEREDWAQANALFSDSGGAIDRFPEDMRVRFQLMMTRAKAASGELNAAQADLKRLDAQPKTAQETEQFDLLQAEVAAGMGEMDLAESSLKAAAKANHRRIRARAEFLLVEAGLRDKTVDAKAAIEKLDRLRFVWRGDALESQILQKLAGLYLDVHDYRAGLQSMREIVTRFPDSTKSPELKEQFVTVFNNLFSSDDVRKLTPVAAVGLYYSFREVLPDVTLSDTLTDQLAERLIQADLLSSAAELLESQMARGPGGLGKAIAGARLAAVYLLDRKPDSALKALDASEGASNDAAVKTERARLLAAAKVAQGKIPEALAILENRDDAGSVALRADIYWNEKNWPEAVANLEALLGQRWHQGTPLNQVERRRVLQLGVAMVLADRPQHLAVLRRQYQQLLDGTAEAEAFAILNDPSRRQGARYSELIRAAAQIKQFEAFMAGYRQKLAGRDPIQAVN